MFYSQTHSDLLLSGCPVEQRYQFPCMQICVEVRIGHKERGQRVNGSSLHCPSLIILLSVIFNITDSNTFCQGLNSEKWARRRICFRKLLLSFEPILFAPAC